MTALHVAIDEDEVELALALLAAGADPNVQTSDEDRTTPLIRACKKGDTELVAALLEAGAAEGFEAHVAARYEAAFGKRPRITFFEGDPGPRELS